MTSVPSQPALSVGDTKSASVTTAEIKALDSPRSQLRAGESLTREQSLVSPNGKARLTLQSDGNVVLSFGQDNKVLWATNTNDGQKLIPQEDGNLVVYNSDNRPRWSSATNRDETKNPTLRIQDDGNVILSAGGKDFWGTDTAISDRLVAPNSLGKDRYLISPNGKYKLVFQGDGNFVLYEGSDPRWASATDRTCDRVQMCDTDNLVVFSYGRKEWSTNTELRSGGGTAALIVQDDGNIIVKSEGKIIWSNNQSLVQKVEPVLSHGNPGGRQLEAGQYLLPGESLVSNNKMYTAQFQPDGNFVLFRNFNNNQTKVWASGSKNQGAVKLARTFDNNMNIYGPDSKVIWSSNTSGRVRGGPLVVEDDGRLYFGSGDNWVKSWSAGISIPSSSKLTELQAGQSMTRDHTLTSPNGNVSLRLAESGNLCINKDGKDTYLYILSKKMVNARVFTFAAPNSSSHFNEYYETGLFEVRDDSDAVFSYNLEEAGLEEMYEQRSRGNDRMTRDEWESEARDERYRQEAMSRRQEAVRGKLKSDISLRVTDEGKAIVGNKQYEYEYYAIWTSDKVSQGSNASLIASTVSGDRLSAYGSVRQLNPGEAMNSPNGEYTLAYQYDGDLVLLGKGMKLWRTGTQQWGAGRAAVQDDGNFVVYNGEGRVAWACFGRRGRREPPGGSKNYELLMQNDGNLVLQGPSGPVWASDTDGGRPRGVDQ